MSQPTAELTAAHLAVAVVPHAVRADVALAESIRRIDHAVAINEAIRVRLPWLPPPAAQQSLGDLVQVARRRLREDRARLAADELGARRSVLDGVLTRLTP